METKEIVINFAQNLRLLRKSKNLSQSELSDLVGVNQRTVSAWENGVAEPDFKTLAELCRIFNEDFNGLLG